MKDYVSESSDTALYKYSISGFKEEVLSHIIAERINLSKHKQWTGVKYGMG